jgi:hypothetical protein
LRCGNAPRFQPWLRSGQRPEKGNVLFFDDIYRHDERLEKALEARRVRR